MKKSLLKEKYKQPMMEVAKIIAKLSYCKKAQVGAVIIKDNRIIATGYNGTATGTLNDCEDENNKTTNFVIHAEENAILQCAKTSSGSDGAVIVVTHSPCERCARMILQSGIKEVYYETLHKNGEGIIFLTENNIQVNKICFEK